MRRTTEMRLQDCQCRLPRELATITWFALLAATSLPAQTTPNLTQYGFRAEPGASVGTPCVLNLMARFWYRNFGVSTCGLYLPSGVNFLNGSGFEGNVMYKLVAGRGARSRIEPYVAAGYGFSNITSAIGSNTLTLVTNYVGLQVGAYYSGAFAQIGVGYGKFQVASGSSNTRIAIVPLIQIGYNFSIGGTASSGGTSGSGSGGGGGGGGSGGTK